MTLVSVGFLMGWLLSELQTPAVVHLYSCFVVVKLLSGLRNELLLSLMQFFPHCHLAAVH